MKPAIILFLLVVLPVLYPSVSTPIPVMPLPTLHSHLVSHVYATTTGSVTVASSVLHPTTVTLSRIQVAPAYPLYGIAGSLILIALILIYRVYQSI